MLKMRPPLASSGRASARGSAMSTPPVIMGAVIMKITMSSIMTSMRLTTLMSAFSAKPRPRRRAILDPPLAHHHGDDVRAEVLQIVFQSIDPVRKNVVPEDGGNG